MKTSLSPLWMPQLLALTFVWVSVSLAENGTNLLRTSASDADSTRLAPVIPPTTSAGTAPVASPGLTPRKDSPVGFPLILSPAVSPINPIGLDSDGFPANNRFSYWTTEVIKLARAGIDDDVLLPFIDSVGTFNLSADEIIFLSDLGVSRQVMTAMIQHDFEVASGLRVPTASASPSSMLLAFGPGNPTAAPAEQPPMNPPSSPATSTLPPPVSEPAAATPRFVPPPAQDTVITYRGDIVSDLAAFDFGRPEQAPPAAAPTPVKSRPGSARTSTYYAVRQPYAEPVTRPIIVIPGEYRTPNVVLIRLNP